MQRTFPSVITTRHQKMTNSSSSHQQQQRLSAPINMSVLGNGGVDAMTSMGGGEPRQSRIVSAASSVISTNSSLCSSSTKGSNGSQHIKSLAKHLSDNNTENESPKAVQSSAPALYPPKNAPAAPSADASSNPMVLHMGAPPHPVAEFLFQLTKMLTDNNPEYIEWRNASIFVHNPPVSLSLLAFNVDHIMCARLIFI
jgi:hypothetical protein